MLYPAELRALIQGARLIARGPAIAKTPFPLAKKSAQSGRPWAIQLSTS